MTKLVRKNDFPSLIDDFFGSVGNDIFQDMFQPARRYADVPRSNVVATEEGSRIEIEAPGMKREDFRIDIDDDRLTVSAHVEKKEKNEFYRRSFTRSWTLHPGTIYDRISASYVDGILKIDVPAKEIKSQKKLTIDVK